MLINFFVLVVTTIALISPLKTNSQDYDSLLSNADIAFELHKKNGLPALSSPLFESEYWESYNEWLCFDSSEIELVKAGVDNEFKDTFIPIILASIPGHSFEISIFGEDQEENDKIFARWELLLEGSRRICAYAAYLNDIEPIDNMPASTWIINTLKTENGYWHYQNYVDSEYFPKENGAVQNSETF